MKNKEKIVTAIILALLISSAGLIGYYFYSLEKQTIEIPEETIQPTKPSMTEKQEQEIQHPACLGDEEWAMIYPSYWDFGSNFEYGTITVYVTNKKDIPTNVSEDEVRRQIEKKNVFNFPIPNVAGSAFPPDMHKCGAYVVRKFDYKPMTEENGKYKGPEFGPKYKKEIWKYEYNGRGKSVLLLAEKDSLYFASEFKVDATEIYIALVRSYFDQPEHALVIKDLKTMEDKYVVTLDELIERYPDIQPATISFDYWGQERFGTGDIIGFHFLNSERTGFNLNVKTGKIEVFR